MKTFDVQARLEYARATVAVLRSLKIANTTMRYGDLARAIGLISEGEEWHAGHRQQISQILRLTAAAEEQGGIYVEIAPLEFDRIVGSDGQPGGGFFKKTRIVSD